MVACLGNASLPAGDPRRLAKAVEEQINGHSGLLDVALTEDAAAWVVHLASLAKRSKGATQSVGGTVIDGVLLDKIQTEQVVQPGPQLVAKKAWDADSTLVLCRSAQRRLKEVAMISTAEQRFLTDSGGVRISTNSKNGSMATSSSARWPIIY